MSDRPLVHIGYHKTATTWWQRAFFPSVRGAGLVPRSVAIEAFVEVDALSFDPVLARRRVEGSTAGRPILSLETLSGYLHNGGLAGALSKDMVSRLHRALPDADIVAFVRRQPDALAASYAQYVRFGGTYSLPRYLFPGDYPCRKHVRRDKNPRFALEHFSYLPLLRLYRRVFGWERVHVFPYEAFRDHPGVFVRAFSRRFGLECPEIERFDRRYNPSPPPWALRLVRSINLFTAGRVLDKTHLIHVPGASGLARALGGVLGACFRSGRPAAERAWRGREWCLRRVESFYVGTNGALAREFDLPLERFGYPGTRLAGARA